MNYSAPYTRMHNMKKSNSSNYIRRINNYPKSRDELNCRSNKTIQNYIDNSQLEKSKNEEEDFNNRISNIGNNKEQK